MGVIIVVCVALYFYYIIRWYINHNKYICPKCNKIFSVGTIKNIFGLNFFTCKYLKCSHCRKFSWCLAIHKRDSKHYNNQRNSASI
jgi:hypothetical protein